MTVRIKIDCDNAAFEDDPAGELGRILTSASLLLFKNWDGTVGNGFPLRDSNGNTVGEVEIVDE